VHGPIVSGEGFEFEKCVALESVEVKYTGNSTFSSCSSLRNVTLLEGMSGICCYAFYRCNNLNNVVIPSTVSNLEDNCFYMCENLNTVYCKATIPPTLGAEIFLDTLTTVQGKLYVPVESVDAYRNSEWRY
jgi:hypothetical protein